MINFAVNLQISHTDQLQSLLSWHPTSYHVTLADADIAMSMLKRYIVQAYPSADKKKKTMHEDFCFV